MTETTSDSPTVSAFIERWARSGAAERANHQLFVSELCDLIGVPHPDPSTPDNSQNAYVFERVITFQDGDDKTSAGFIDLYKRGCFVLEAKQGADALTEEPMSIAAQELKRKLRKGHGQRGSGAWDDSMLRARGQADRYIRALSTEEGRPPFLIVLDVGHSIELFSEFSCTGGTYIPFPAAGSHRIFLPDLQRPEIRERLKEVWTNPSELDPTRRSARVTREIASQLAKLAVSLEKAGHTPEIASAFLMRCLFTMFAEDVGLLTNNVFTHLLDSLRDTPEHFAPMIEELWGKMNTGGFSTSLRTTILQFNGGLFADSSALNLTQDQVQLLIEAAKSDWHDVEPAIFGTLLERALDPVERHKLGAHYTPRAYVERLVMPTVINPVREEWEAVHVAAVSLANQGEMEKAVAEVTKFHRKLVKIRVLDPACGSGNFLYVTLEHLKRIEGEVFDALDSFGHHQSVLEMEGETVDPHQLLGIEINPRAAGIAELVLRIGALQWHFRNRGNVPPAQPIIRNFHNIECRDALIDCDRVENVLDADGNPVTHWDGRTTKPHPVTGKEVPDETARTPVYQYINPRKAEWPETDYIVGNPPFIGARRIRLTLGGSYLDTVRAMYPLVPENCDFVLYWWHKAALLASEGRINRFGFITTNSITQSFAGKLLAQHMQGKNPVSLLFAIPDHPWVQTEDGAAVRIAMTVGSGGTHEGSLNIITQEGSHDENGADIEVSILRGNIGQDLRVGVDILQAVELSSNKGVCSVGYQLSGKGFVLGKEDVDRFSGVDVKTVLRPLISGRDIMQKPRNFSAIDVHMMEEEDLRQKYPSIYQWLIDNVRPERLQNRECRFRDAWWKYVRGREDFRLAVQETDQVLCTCLTAKHRVFVSFPCTSICDSTTVMFALADSLFLGVLSSRIHVCWALASGGTLEDRPRYNKTRCFETFPFPPASDEQKASIRELAEQLDTHRKRQLEQHPGLTMTGMYNVLEKLRCGEALSTTEKTLHEQGLVSVLKQLHDELDKAVFDAYGWPATLSDAEILERLVALNAQRAAEEAQGKIRWLRPEYQCPAGAAPQQGELAVTGDSEPDETLEQAKATKLAWPKSLPDQVRILREALSTQTGPATAEAIARQFIKAPKDRVEELLETLVAMGQARAVGDAQFIV